jgi:hypothetical protein
VTPHTGAHAVTELIMNTQPGAILAPGAPGLVGRLPMGQIVWHQAPGTAGAQHVLDAIEHLTQGVFTRSPPSFFRRQEGFQDVLLLVA